MSCVSFLCRMHCLTYIAILAKHVCLFISIFREYRFLHFQFIRQLSVSSSLVIIEKVDPCCFSYPIFHLKLLDFTTFSHRILVLGNRADGTCVSLRYCANLQIRYEIDVFHMKAASWDIPSSNNFPHTLSMRIFFPQKWNIIYLLRSMNKQYSSLLFPWYVFLVTCCWWCKFGQVYCHAGGKYAQFSKFNNF